MINEKNGSIISERVDSHFFANIKAFSCVSGGFLPARMRTTNCLRRGSFYFVYMESQMNLTILLLLRLMIFFAIS
jgi:hypothetical protein